MKLNWKHNWAETRQHFNDWWAGHGLVLNLGDFPVDQPYASASDPGEPATLQQRHTDPAWIAARSRAERANRNYELGDVLPVAFVDKGTVSLAAYLGAQVELSDETIWYHPRPEPPEDWDALKFDTDAEWFRIHEAVYRQAMAAAQNDFLIGQPGIGSNIEVLAALRGTETLMLDLIENPEWVHARMNEINQAFFAAYERIHELIRLPDNSSCTSYFALWGPGKMSVITLDPIAMISQAMFEEFVLPPLIEQIDWLDLSMLHIDGTAALRHLDMILDIPGLDAVEWTPEQPAQPNGGDPCWYPLYRRIKDAGKAVQAVGVEPEQVVPLLENVGAQGMYITAFCRDAAEAETLLKAVEPYR